MPRKSRSTKSLPQSAKWKAAARGMGRGMSQVELLAAVMESLAHGKLCPTPYENWAGALKATLDRIDTRRPPFDSGMPIYCRSTEHMRVLLRPIIEEAEGYIEQMRKTMPADA